MGTQTLVSITGKITDSGNIGINNVTVALTKDGTAAGTVQNKVTDAAGAARMSLTAALGHACGRDFKAAEHLAKYPEFAWQKEILRDMNARPWTRFTAK